MIVAEHELIAPGSVSILGSHHDWPRPAPISGPRPEAVVETQFAPSDRMLEGFWSASQRSGTWQLQPTDGVHARAGSSGPDDRPGPNGPWWFRLLSDEVEALVYELTHAERAHFSAEARALHPTER